MNKDFILISVALGLLILKLLMKRWRRKKKFLDYYKYIKSADWKKRKKYLYRHLKGEYACAVCKQKFALQVHHINYKHLGAERPQDVIYLCENHHRQISLLYKKNKSKMSLEKTTKKFIKKARF